MGQSRKQGSGYFRRQYLPQSTSMAHSASSSASMVMSPAIRYDQPSNKLTAIS